GFRDGVEGGEDVADGGHDAPGGRGGAGGVDGDVVEAVEELVGVAVGGEGFGGAGACHLLPRSGQDEEVRVLELRGAAVEVQLAGEHGASAGGEDLGQPAGVEEGRGEAVVAVGDGDAGDVRLVSLEDVDVEDAAYAGDHVAFDGVVGEHVGAVAGPGAGCVLQEVHAGGVAESLAQGGGLLLGEDLRERSVVAPAEHVYSTPISTRCPSPSAGKARTSTPRSVVSFSTSTSVPVPVSRMTCSPPVASMSRHTPETASSTEPLRVVGMMSVRMEAAASVMV